MAREAYAMPTIKVLLTGGPLYVTESMRSHEVANLDDSIKIPYGNGYEHFRYEGENNTVENEDTTVLFTWKGRTKIAE
jgi:hypothetical protein